jgi:lysyl-tRNA synthetase class II
MLLSRNWTWEILLEFAENCSELKQGEVTVRAKEYRLVSKALRPLPEKWHGLTDNDQIYRQRYLDLIVNEESVSVFEQEVR